MNQIYDFKEELWAIVDLPSLCHQLPTIARVYVFVTQFFVCHSCSVEHFLRRKANTGDKLSSGSNLELFLATIPEHTRAPAGTVTVDSQMPKFEKMQCMWFSFHFLIRNILHNSWQ